MMMIVSVDRQQWQRKMATSSDVAHGAPSRDIHCCKIPFFAVATNHPYIRRSAIEFNTVLDPLSTETAEGRLLHWCPRKVGIDAWGRMEIVHLDRRILGEIAFIFALPIDPYRPFQNG